MGGSFRVCQYSSFHTYVDCHVIKNKIQTGAVIIPLPKHVLVSSISDNQNNGRLLIAKGMTCTQNLACFATRLDRRRVEAGFWTIVGVPGNRRIQFEKSHLSEFAL
jgi:hypothetical protein